MSQTSSDGAQLQQNTDIAHDGLLPGRDVALSGGETAHDAIPPETSNKTMKLLIRPQSSCQLQCKYTEYTKDCHCGEPSEVQHPLQQKQTLQTDTKHTHIYQL